jgi:hypothetical protein
MKQKASTYVVYFTLFEAISFDAISSYLEAMAQNINDKSHHNYK